MIPNLLEKYRKEIVPQMQEKFGYKSPMQVPAIKKVVVNMGGGRRLLMSKSWIRPRRSWL